MPVAIEPCLWGAIMKAYWKRTVRNLICNLWFSIAVAAAFFGFVAPGLAQVSPNIQTQAIIMAPPVTATVPSGPPTSSSDPWSILEAAAHGALSGANDKCTRVAATQLKQKLAFIDKFAPLKLDKFSAAELVEKLKSDPAFAKAILDRLYEHVRKLNNLSAFDSKESRNRYIQQFIQPSARYCDGQPTVIKASLIFNPTFETNALKSGPGGSTALSSDLGGSALVTTGVGEKRPYDIVFLSVQSASQRYTTYVSKSLDTFTAQSGYQLLIDGYYYDEVSAKRTGLDKDDIPLINNSGVTYESATFGVFSQTLFLPTYLRKSAELFTPQVTLAGQNYNLGARSQKCDTNATVPEPKTERTLVVNNFCNYADFSITGGQTFSDTPTLQNINLALASTVGMRIKETGWTIAGQVTLTGRAYENVPGGRQDFLVQAGPVFTYAFANSSHKTDASSWSNSCIFQLPINYFQNYSTVTKDAWSGLIIQPTLTISFMPPPSPAVFQ